MEKEYIKLTDGREVLRGPWFEGVAFLGASGVGRVGVFAIHQRIRKEHGERWGDSITILEVNISANYYSVRLPDIKILEKELWTKDLIAKVISGIRKSSMSKKAVEYIVVKLSGTFEKEKELILEDGRRLIGDLEFSLDWSRDAIGHDDLSVLGDIKDPKTGELQKVTLLTIRNLYPAFWPGSTKSPSYVKNKEFWCKKLEYLVINYLNLLVDFAKKPLDKQISEIARDLASRSEWAVKCHSIFQKLLSLSPDLREDEKISQAFELINEASQI